jgi:hypothetical protein
MLKRLNFGRKSGDFQILYDGTELSPEAPCGLGKSGRRLREGRPGQPAGEDESELRLRELVEGEQFSLRNSQSHGNRSGPAWLEAKDRGDSIVGSSGRKNIVPPTSG